MAPRPHGNSQEGSKSMNSHHIYVCRLCVLSWGCCCYNLRESMLCSPRILRSELVALAARSHVRPQDPLDVSSLAHLEGALPDLVGTHLEAGSHFC